jgi:hypothetical protein
MQRRRRFRRLLFLTERVHQEAALLRAQAEKLPHGSEREKLIRKAREADTATHIDEWLDSPGLRTPQ